MSKEKDNKKWLNLESFEELQNVFEKKNGARLKFPNGEDVNKETIIKAMKKAKKNAFKDLGKHWE